MSWLSSIRAIGRRSPRADPTVPEGTVVWAIGDIHGRADLLAPLLEAIQQDFARSSAARRVVVGLGDYVDRGPDSRAVIEALCALSRTDVETHFLRGNHEDQMELFLTQPEVGRSWAEFGGRETLWSYGVDPPLPNADEDAWRAASEALAAALPVAHRRFLGLQETAVAIGGYFFCHAGARPGVALDDQSARDLMWIRAEFLADSRRFDRIVVHGHTPEAAVHADDRRIGIDTGAYATGVLTALRLEGAERSLLQTERRAGAPGVSLRQTDLATRA